MTDETDAAPSQCLSLYDPCKYKPGFTHFEYVNPNAPKGGSVKLAETGTFDSLMQAGQFVQVIEQRQGIKISCIEEIVYRKGFITKEQLLEMAQPLLKSGYGQYLMNIANEE